MPSVGTGSVDLEVDRHQLGRAIRSAVDGNRGTLNSVGRSMGQALNTSFNHAFSIGKTVAKGAAVVATGVLAIGAAAVGTGVKMGNELEKAELQFETLTGSAQKAEKIVKDLFTFAKRTPFETGPVIEAARTLQTFGGDALNTSKSLTLVGDAAAATSSEITEVSFWVGRAYSAIQSGKPFGEAAMRLQELAILSPKARDEMEKLQKEGASASEVWRVMEGDLSKFNGAMAKQAGTWEGLTSTLSDAFKMSSQRVFEPFRGLMKDVAGDAIKLTESGLWESWTNKATAAVAGVVGHLQTLRAAIKDVAGDEAAAGATPFDSISTSLERLSTRLEADMPKIAGAFGQISALLENIDTSNGVGGAIQSMFDGIDPAALAGRFTDIFVGVVNSMDFGRFSEALTTFILNTILEIDVSRIVAELPTIANQIIDGIIEGLFRAATENPVDFVLLLVTLGFVPAKITGAIARVLGKIPIIGPIMEWVLKGMTGVAQRVTEPIRKEFKKLGSDLIEGLIQGIKSLPGKVVGAVTGVLGKAVSAGKNLLGIRSPSKVFHEIGSWSMEGLALGVLDKESRVVDAVGRATRSMTASVAGVDIPAVRRTAVGYERIAYEDHLSPGGAAATGWAGGDIVVRIGDTEFARIASEELRRRALEFS